MSCEGGLHDRPLWFMPAKAAQRALQQFLERRASLGFAETTPPLLAESFHNDPKETELVFFIILGEAGKGATHGKSGRLLN